MGHHNETNQKKTKAFQSIEGEKTGLMTGDSITTFDLQQSSNDSKTTKCFTKKNEIKKICYRAEDITPPDGNIYDKWKADWNPEEDNFYKHLRTGQEFYVSQKKTNEIITDIKERIRTLQLATRQIRSRKRGGKRKTRKRMKKKTRKKRKNRKKRTRKR